MGIISRVWGRFRGDESAHKAPFILEGVNGNVCNKDFRWFGTTTHSCNSRKFWKTMPPISTHKKAYVRVEASLIKPRSVKTKGNKTLQAVIFKHSPLAKKLLNQAGKHQEPENWNYIALICRLQFD